MIQRNSFYRPRVDYPCNVPVRLPDVDARSFTTARSLKNRKLALLALLCNHFGHDLMWEPASSGKGHKFYIGIGQRYDAIVSEVKHRAADAIDDLFTKVINKDSLDVQYPWWRTFGEDLTSFKEVGQNWFNFATPEDLELQLVLAGICSKLDNKVRFRKCDYGPVRDTYIAKVKS